MIKTISFDLWGTLIKANPEYSIKRIELIKKYNPELLDEYITFVLKSIKKDFDYLVEKYGIQHNINTLYSAIFTKLDIHYDAWDSLIKELEKTFIRNPPVLYDNNIISVLSQLKNDGYRLILISNTLLISGEILYKSLPELFKFINNNYYSDEIGLSKPNINIFSMAYDNKYDIIHIGDNLITDIDGATNYGINTLHINGTSNKTIIDVIPFLNSLNK